ncbi:MAG: tRNA adenosine(34) deaminase TadA [Nitrospiria bacterium]
MFKNSFSSQDTAFMQLALDEAISASGKGEVPVGALLVEGSEIISQSHNLRETIKDPTAHAEILVIKEASRRLNRWRLSNLTLYVTLEPCAMCAGALIQARISRLVFGCFDPKAGVCGSLMNILQDKRLNHRVDIQAGCLEKECAGILKQFFSELRSSKPGVIGDGPPPDASNTFLEAPFELHKL